MVVRIRIGEAQGVFIYYFPSSRHVLALSELVQPGEFVSCQPVCFVNRSQAELVRMFLCTLCGREALDIEDEKEQPEEEADELESG